MAKNQAAQNITNTVFDVKRLISRKISDDKVQADEKLIPFNIVGCEAGGKGGKPVVQIYDVDGKGTINYLAILSGGDFGNGTEENEGDYREFFGVDSDACGGDGAGEL